MRSGRWGIPESCQGGHMAGADMAILGTWVGGESPGLHAVATRSRGPANCNS